MISLDSNYYSWLVSKSRIIRTKHIKERENYAVKLLRDNMIYAAYIILSRKSCYMSKSIGIPHHRMYNHLDKLIIKIWILFASAHLVKFQQCIVLYFKSIS